jgi:hypothetical protein
MYDLELLPADPWITVVMCRLQPAIHTQCIERGDTFIAMVNAQIKHTQHAARFPGFEVSIVVDLHIYMMQMRISS